MADNRVIHSAVRMGGVKDGKRFTKGELITDPDALEASGADLQALFDSGAISGDWKGVKVGEVGGESETHSGKKASKKGK